MMTRVVFDIREVRLCDFEQGAVSTYHYDFGDSWRHSVVIEEFAALDIFLKAGTCIDGARARPPEDVGGVPGYERFLEIMADRTDPEHADTRRWCGDTSTRNGSIWAVVDKDVRNALKPNVKRRLYQPKPKRDA